MSRARLFKRAVNWLKKCVSTKDQVKHPKSRRYGLGQGFDQLEDRIVLNADFGFNAGSSTLELQNFSGAGQTLTVGETATDITFTLGSGTWSGANIPGEFSATTDTLSVDKGSLTAENIAAIGGGFDLIFGAVDFDNLTVLTSLTMNTDNVTQTGAVTATAATVTLIGDDITLDNAANDFNTITLDGAAISLDDDNGLNVDITSTGNVDLDAGGAVNFTGTSVTNTLNIDSTANGGAGGNITIDDTVADSIVITAGNGDVDASDAQNNANSWTVNSGSQVEITDADSVTINDVSVSDTLFVETLNSGDIDLDGTLTATNLIGLDSDGAVGQTSGTIETLRLLMKAGTDGILDANNMIGNGGIGIVAGSAGNEFFVRNTSGLRVDSVTYGRLGGGVETATGLNAAKVRLDALSILLTAATNATNNVVLESDQGANQNAAGVITAAGIILEGEGDFLLDSDNQIGTLLDPGKLAADVLGSIGFTNLFGLLIAQLICDSTTFAGVNVQTDGAANSGDLTLDTSSNDMEISQEADAPIIVQGESRFIAGLGTICLRGGDLDTNTVTDNNLSTVFIETASQVEIADIDDIQIELAGLAGETFDTLSIDAGGAIQLNDDLEVTDQIHLKAGNGVEQQASTFIEALELLVEGNGNFNLTERNRIGGIATPGRLAANVNGSLSLVNDLDLLIDDLTFDFKDLSSVSITGVTVNQGASTGNFIVSTSNDDVSQTAAAQVISAGLASFDVGTGCLELNVSANNDFTRFGVVSSDETEMSDSVGNVIITDVNATDSAFLRSSGLMTISGSVVTGTIVILHSDGGVTEGFGSTIDTNQLIARGSGLFRLDSNNDIQGPTGIGSLAVDIDGDFSLTNSAEIQIQELSRLVKSGATIEVTGVNVTGDFFVELPDADFTQAADAPFISGGTATFDVGAGCVDLSFGDGDNDTFNDNDMNFVEVLSAAIAEFVDSNDLNLDEITVSDRFRAEAGGELVIDRDLRATNQVFLGAQNGLTQNSGSTIETAELLLRGTGDFILDQLNTVGSGLTPGQVAAEIDGSLTLLNNFDVNIASLTFTQKDTTDIDIAGVNIDNTTGSGNLSVHLDGLTLSQSNRAPVVVTGLASFDVGSNGTVNLPFGDTTIDGLAINENDFNEIAVDNAGVVEIADIDSFTIIGTIINDRAAFTSDTGTIILDGNVFVFDTVMFKADAGLLQKGGVIDSDNLLARGSGYFDFSGPNQLGNIFAPGLFAANVDGNVNLMNIHKIQVDTVDYFDLSGRDLSNNGVGASGGVLDNFRIKANGIEIRERTQANTVALVSSDGITQVDDFLTNGIIVSNELSVVGQGIVRLLEGNRIGSLGNRGDVAINVDGEVDINNVFGIDFDAVTFVFEDGSTRTNQGVFARELNGFGGNLFVRAGGDITDAADTNIIIQNGATFIADGGNGNITLGDTFSNFGPDNRTHFGTVAVLGQNVNISEDSSAVLDGSLITGNFTYTAFGNIHQSGDVATLEIGTAAIEVDGDATFILDANTQPANHLNDTRGRDVRLMARPDNELIDNLFNGDIVIRGTASNGALNGNGTLRNIEIRNSVFEMAEFPTIIGNNDPLRSLTVWTPNSSLNISQDLDIKGNLNLFAGVDSQSGRVGGTFNASNELLKRRLTDAANTDITVGGNANFKSGNIIELANSASDSLIVNGRLSTSVHTETALSRITIGVANNGPRGADVGSTVRAGTLKFIARQSFIPGSENVTINVDGNARLTEHNQARSLVLVADGNITDDASASLFVRHGATLRAGGNKDIILGDDFSNNFQDNNVVNFGSFGAVARNINVTEDSAAKLDGIRANGRLTYTANGNIAQSGEDRNGIVGTRFIHVKGIATFKIDGNRASNNQMNDPFGRDVRLVSSQGVLMNNRFSDRVNITSTSADGSNRRNGSVRDVEVRNFLQNSDIPTFNLTNQDKIRNLFVWTPNSSLRINNDIEVVNNFRAFAGVDAANGMRNGNLRITNNAAMRNLTDASGVQITAGNQLDFRVANRLTLADNANDRLISGNLSQFITLGGQGNEIRVGQANGAPRGTDSGATFQTDVLRFKAPTQGAFGRVTVIGDKSYSITPDSVARSAITLP